MTPTLDIADGSELFLCPDDVEHKTKTVYPISEKRKAAIWPRPVNAALNTCLPFRQQGTHRQGLVRR